MVAPGRDQAYGHLVGNVAEYVLAGTGNAGILTDRSAGPGEAIAQLENAATRLGTSAVIGGSALSPPGLPVDRPSPIDFNTGYADVGFRLAFSAGLEAPLVVRLIEAMGDAPFLRLEGSEDEG